MNANAVFDAACFELDTLCLGCQEQSSLRSVVAELLYKNQLLRFKLSQAEALVGQLRLAFDHVPAYPGSVTELQRALNGLSALLKPELEC